MLQSDGLTPLSGPVGPLSSGATYTVVVRCTIPAAQASGGSVTLTATSVSGPSGSIATLQDGLDATTLSVTTVLSGFGVDLAHNTNGSAGGESADPANDTRLGFNPAVNPGGTALFPSRFQTPVKAPTPIFSRRFYPQAGQLSSTPTATVMV